MASKLVRELLKKHPGAKVWDAAEYLDTPEAIEAYLDEAMDASEGDQAVLMKALNTVARAQKRNMSQLAKEAGITRSGLYEALSAEGNPSFATVQKLVAALGLRLRFRQAQ